MLDKVKNMLEEKAGVYGKGDACFELIAKYWTVYKGVRITSVDVAQMMVLFKMARGQVGIHQEDNYIDQICYSIKAGNMAVKNQIIDDGGEKPLPTTATKKPFNFAENNQGGYSMSFKDKCKIT